MVRDIEVVATAEAEDEVLSPETINSLLGVSLLHMLRLVREREEEGGWIKAVVAKVVVVAFPLDLREPSTDLACICLHYN
jgi:hypothetical protein